MSTLTAVTVALLVLAPDALARQTGGEGLYGQTTDKVITNAMFLVILFFPTIIIIFSLIQWRLEKRKPRADGRGQAPRGERRLARRLVGPRAPATSQ